MKRYGVHMTLPEGDPMAAPHLLGPDWESTRWFGTESERKVFIRDMTGRFIYYRIGDRPSLEIDLVEKENP